MNFQKYFACFSILSVSLFAQADPATYDASWQWNTNVKIDKIMVYWDTSDTRIYLSNGEICRINKADKELYAAALAARAQGLSGEVLCQKDPIAGSAERRAHRLAF